MSTAPAPPGSAELVGQGAPATRSWRDLPGPRGFPILGVAPRIDPESFHTILENWYAEFGGPFVFRLGRRPFVAIADPEAMREVLHHRPEGFTRSQKVSRAIEELGANGVFTAEAADWKRQRPLFSHAFQPELLQSYAPQIIEIADRLRERWERASQTGEPRDIQLDFERFTTDVMLKIAFGYETNTLGGKRDQLQDDMTLVFPEINARIRAPIPLWRYFKTPKVRAVERAIARIRTELFKRVNDVRSELRADAERRAAPRTILDAIIAAELDEENPQLSEEEVFGNILTALLAGEDTTAHTLSWIAHEMTRDTSVQERLREEADCVLSPSLGLRSFSDMKALRYLEGVARETLRLRSVAPMLFMDPTEATTVAGIEVGPEVGVAAMTRLGATDDDYFSEGQSFLPERWMREDPTAKQRCPVHETRAAMGFGAGPRICPGRGLAMLEIHAAMSVLVRNFELEAVSEPSAVTERFAFTMSPKGLRVRVKSRA